MRARWDQAPAAARARGHAGNQRLHQRWADYSRRGKKHTVANTKNWTWNR